MSVLMELLVKLISLIVIMIYLVGLLFVMLISVVYIVGYVCDSIFGNSFISLGHFISGKYPKIKNISIVKKLWKKIQPKELYLRYETPLFTYCFSYTAISLLALVLPNENGIPMMGGYVFYYKERIFGGIYGNGFLVKITETSKKFMQDSEPEPPYEGAKFMLPVTILDDRTALQNMVEEMYPELPERKSKKKKV